MNLEVGGLFFALPGRSMAFKVFTFLMAGYRQDRWFWEAIVMVRKMAIVFAVVFVTDRNLQMYAPQPEIRFTPTPQLLLVLLPCSAPPPPSHVALSNP